MARKLKYWNGRVTLGNDVAKNKEIRKTAHGYIAATSQKRAVELAGQAGLGHFTLNEIRVYWAECWGTDAKWLIGSLDSEGVWIIYRHRGKTQCRRLV